MKLILVLNHVGTFIDTDVLFVRDHKTDSEEGVFSTD